MLENSLNEHASAWKGNEAKCCVRVISEEVNGGDIVHVHDELFPSSALEFQASVWI